MNKKLLAYLGFSLVVLAGCTTKDISPNVEISYTGVNSTGLMSINGNTGSLISDSSLSGYAPVSLLDSEYFGQQRQEGDQLFYVNDKNWKGNYYAYRNWFYIGAMGIQAADVLYGYYSGGLFMEIGASIVQFQVDEKTYISYYPKLENPNYTGTGTLQVQDKRKNYQICKDGYNMEQMAIGTSWEEYNSLLNKNPMRCFGEDKTYIYGRREYKQSEEGGYELMRVKK